MESKNESYVISLDAVDLNLLPISQTHRDGGAESDDTKDKNEPVIENVTCHICDMNVPKGYFNEHKNGFRHKFNRKVADTALKRLLLYVNKEDHNELNEKLHFKHFCQECSIIIDSETSHKQTTGHRNSLFLERFLNEFLNFYMNEDNKIDDTRKNIKTEVVKESKNSEQDFLSDEPNNTETVLANIKQDSVTTEVMKESTNFEQDLVSDEPNITETVLANRKQDGVTTEVMKESTNFEQDLVSDEPNITETVLANIKQDGVTTEVMKESTNFEQDLVSDEPNITETELANIKQDGVTTEVMKESTNFEQDLVSDEPNITETVLANIKQDGVTTEVMKESTNFEQDLVSDEPNITETVLANRKQDGVTTEVMKESTNFEQDLVSDEPNITETELAHMKKESIKNEDEIETKDTENYKTIFSSDELNNNLRPSSGLRDEDAFLEVFDGSNINNSKVTEMCYDENSTKCSEDLTSDENKCSTDTNKDTAPVNIGTRNSLTLSTSSPVAKNETVENGDKTVKLDPNSYFCEVCQCKVPNNLNNLAQHNRGGSHITNLRYQMKKTERLNYLNCIVCNINLTYNDRNIFNHIVGERHKKNYNKFCKRNLLVRRDKFLYCTACGVIPGRRNEFTHCSGHNHKLNLEEVVSN